MCGMFVCYIVMMLVCLVLIVVWFACMFYLDDDSCGEIGDQKMVLIIGYYGFLRRSLGTYMPHC